MAWGWLVACVMVVAGAAALAWRMGYDRGRRAGDSEGYDRGLGNVRVGRHDTPFERPIEPRPEEWR